MEPWAVRKVRKAMRFAYNFVMPDEMLVAYDTIEEFYLDHPELFEEEEIPVRKRKSWRGMNIRWE